MSLVLCLRKSRTATFPRETLVSVPSQRPGTVQILPRAAADEYRPRWRNPPFALPRQRRILRLLRAALAFFPRFLCELPHPVKLAPFKRSSVSPLALVLPD